MGWVILRPAATDFLHRLLNRRHDLFYRSRSLLDRRGWSLLGRGCGLNKQLFQGHDLLFG
jgi:hypothetical protein